MAGGLALCLSLGSSFSQRSCLSSIITEVIVKAGCLAVIVV